MKKIKFLLIPIIIVIVGAGIYYFYYTNQQYNKLTVNEKFIKNKYKMVDNGNYVKNLNETDYYLFYLILDLKYFVVDIDGQYAVYYPQNDWAHSNLCEYNFTNNSANEGTECSEEDIEKVKEVKNVFNKELKKIKITLDDLITVKVVDMDGNEIEDAK